MPKAVEKLVAYLHVQNASAPEFPDAAWRICYDFTPVIEPVVAENGVAEAFLDLTGCLDGWRVLGRLSRALAKAVGRSVRFGAGTNKLIAKAAFLAQQPRGSSWVVVPAGKERSFLAPLSVDYLWPLAPEARAELFRLGLNRIDDLHRAGVQALVDQLGPVGFQIAALAEGRDHEPVRALWPEKVFRLGRNLEAPITDARALRRLLARLVEELSAELVGAGSAGLVVIALKLGIDGVRRELSLKEAGLDPGVLGRAAWRLWEKMGGPVPTTSVEVEFQVKEGVAVMPAARYSFMAAADKISIGRQKRLEQSLSEVRRRFGGDGAIHAASQLPLTWREQALQCYLGYLG